MPVHCCASAWLAKEAWVCCEPAPDGSRFGSPPESEKQARPHGQDGLKLREELGERCRDQHAVYLHGFSRRLQSVVQFTLCCVAHERPDEQRVGEFVYMGGGAGGSQPTGGGLLPPLWCSAPPRGGPSLKDPRRAWSVSGREAVRGRLGWRRHAGAGWPPPPEWQSALMPGGREKGPQVVQRISDVVCMSGGMSSGHLPVDGYGLPVSARGCCSLPRNIPPVPGPAARAASQGGRSSPLGPDREACSVASHDGEPGPSELPRDPFV